MNSDTMRIFLQNIYCLYYVKKTALLICQMEIKKNIN